MSILLKKCFYVFRPCLVSHRIVVPTLDIELVPPALGVWSLNHWTAGEVPRVCTLNHCPRQVCALGNFVSLPSCLTF